MTSLKKGLKIVFRRFLDWVFRGKSLTACLYILIVFAVRELVAIYYGNDIYDLLVELEKNLTQEWIKIFIKFIKLFFKTGFWMIFLIEAGLICLVSFLIYINSHKPLKIETIDSSIAKYSISVKFTYILYNFFCFQRDLFVPGIYETTFEKQRILHIYQRLKSNCHMLFEKHESELPISKDEFQIIMSITDELRQENEIILDVLSKDKKVSSDLWDFTNKLGSKGLMLVKELVAKVNNNEYESLINNDLKNQLLGFKNQKDFKEYVRPSADSILHQSDSRELSLVKYVIKEGIINIEHCLSFGFEESEFAELYNKLNRSNLAHFENGNIVISSKGLQLLKDKLRNYKFVKVKSRMNKILILD